MKRLAVVCVLSLFALAAFPQFDCTFNYNEALPSDFTKSVLEISSLNEIWVGTYQGIARYNESSWIQETDLDGASNLNSYEMIEAFDGSVWVALGGGGVAKYESGVWTNYTVSQGLASNSNWSIAQDSSGNIWVGSTDAGVSVYDGSSWSIFNTDDGLIGNSVVEILCTYRGDVWLGTANGVSVFRNGEFRNLSVDDGLPSNLIRDLYQDFDGNICVGTSNGIGVFNEMNWSYLTTENGMPTNNVISISQLRNGDFLYGTDIGLIHNDGVSFELLSFEDGLASDIVKSVTVDSRERIWLCSPFHGVSVVDVENSSAIFRTNQNLVDDEIQCLCSENDTLWIGTNNGANSFNGELWRTFNVQDGLIGDVILDIAFNEDKTYFACIGGLSVYSDQSFSNFTMSNGLLSDTITAVEVLNDGTIYLGTYCGLMEITTDGIFTNYTTLDGLANDTVWDVEKDITGNLWIGTKNGLSEFSEGTFVNFDETELGGVNIKSLLINQIGDVYLTTENSLACYSSSSWVNFPYDGFTGSVSDITDAGSMIYLIHELTGNVYCFNKILESFNPVPGITHQKAIEFIDNTYLYVGNDMGLKRVDLVSEPINSFSVVNPLCPEMPNGSIEIDEPVDNPPYMYSIDNGVTYQSNHIFANLPFGQYHVKVKNAMEQVTLDTALVLEPQHWVDAVIDIDHVNCNGNADGVVELFMSDQTNTFSWSDSGSGMLRENLSPDIYGVTVSNAFCGIVRSNIIAEPQEMMVNVDKEDVLCYGDNTGLINLTVSGGVVPYVFQWSNLELEEDVSDLVAGDYSFTVSDVNGCNVSQSVSVDQPLEALSVTGTSQDVLCNGGSDGEILLEISGGTSGYSVNWSDGVSEEDRVGILAGNYAVTVVDSHNCTVSDTFLLSEPEALEFTLVVYDDVLCYGENNGSVSVVTEGGTGNHDFEWTMTGEPGVFSTDQNIDMLEAGEYSLLVNDENGCQIDSVLTIEEPSFLSMGFDMIPVTCQGYNDAEIEALPSGGSAPYISYYWSYADNPTIIGVSAEILNCHPGWYHVTVTDAHYCEIVDSVEVINPPAHTIELLVTDMPCHGNEAGEIEVLVDGGATTELTYQWSNGTGDFPVATGLGSGIHIVTITDATNCELLDSVEIIEPELAELGAFDQSGIGWLCNGYSTVLDAGEGYSSYLWSDGSDQQTIEVNNENTYSVFVVDSDGCEYGDTIEVELSYPYDDEEICFLSVDAEDNVNVLWNKTPDVGTSAYNIYKENSQGTEYELLATIPYSEASLFVDTASDASLSDEAYKISVIDTCGNESSLSEMQSSISLSVYSDLNGACSLYWDDYEGYFVVYYFIMRGTSPENMQVVDSVLYSDFNYAEMNPDADGVYYKIMVKRPDVCSPGNGSDYGYAYSNVVYCDNLTGIAKMNYGAIDVYPNPFENEFIINLYLNIPRDVKLRLFDGQGQLVYDTTYNGLMQGENSLSVSDLELKPGLYNLQLHFGDQIWQKKIVKY